jgi:hypothetical protein
MAPTKAERFLDGRLSGDLLEVPGIGAEHGIPNLNKHGIKTSYQLIGHFLKLNRNVDAFADFLVTECKGVKQHMTKTAEAINERVSKKGFTCDIMLSDHVIATSTKFDDTKKTDFLKRKLSNTLEDDFMGIGPDTVKEFAAVGIRNTDQLFGAFLSIIDDPDVSKNTSKCDDFYDKLKKMKAARGYKSVIIYQLQAKLAIGIDTHGPEALKLRHLLPTVREVSSGALDEEEFDAVQDGAPLYRSPSTGEGSLKSKPAAGTHPPRELDFSEPAPKPAPKPGPSVLPMAVCGILFAVGAYYFFL